MLTTLARRASLRIVFRSNPARFGGVRLDLPPRLRRRMGGCCCCSSWRLAPASGSGSEVAMPVRLVRLRQAAGPPLAGELLTVLVDMVGKFIGKCCLVSFGGQGGY